MGDIIQTEWELQTKLTSKWIREGLSIAGQKLFLASWEVMINSWKINDALKHWNEPSIDFLFLDREGNICLVELKRYILTPRDAWLALCQVTHRSIALKKTYTWGNLEKSFKAAYSGNHGRVETVQLLNNLLETHQKFFKLNMPISRNRFGKNQFFRVVAALKFNSIWEGIREEFANNDLKYLQNHIETLYKVTTKTKEFDRFMSLNPADFMALKVYPPKRLLITK